MYVIKTTANRYFEFIDQQNNNAVYESAYLTDAAKFKSEAAARAYADKHGVWVHAIEKV